MANEIALIHELFDKGLEIFHLRKPEWSQKQHQLYLKKIKPKYLNRVVVHYNKHICKVFIFPTIHERFSILAHSNTGNDSVSCSTHSWSEFKQVQKRVKYAFISPFFNSISKKGYQANRTLWHIPPDIIREKAIALGGVSTDNLAQIKALNLGGIAVLGAIWQSPDPVETFTILKSISSE